MWQQDPSLPPPAALVSADGPQDLARLRLLPLLDVERPGVLPEHVVPEGHAQVGVRRGDGWTDQRRHLLLVVVFLSGFTRRVVAAQLHEDEVPRSSCRGRQKTR